jgi:hypothetical protein
MANAIDQNAPIPYPRNSLEQPFFFFKEYRRFSLLLQHDNSLHSRKPKKYNNKNTEIT